MAGRSHRGSEGPGRVIEGETAEEAEEVATGDASGKEALLSPDASWSSQSLEPSL